MLKDARAIDPSGTQGNWPWRKNPSLRLIGMISKSTTQTSVMHRVPGDQVPHNIPICVTVLARSDQSRADIQGGQSDLVQPRDEVAPAK